MNIRTVRSFSTELLKIAHDLGDAEIRATLAERRGEEYLKGGELPSDSVTPPALVATKTANYAMAAPSLLHAHTRDNSKYQGARDTAVKALGGAAGGAGAMKLVHDMKGATATPRAYRAAAGAGVGLALADKLYRHRTKTPEPVKVAMVEQNPGAAFKSPAESLASNSSVGKFKNVVHQSSAKVPGLLGRSSTAHTL